MNCDNFQRKPSITNSSPLERKSPCSYTKDLAEFSDFEVKIMNWLDKNGVSHGIPQEKEFQYYQNQKKSLKNHSFHRIYLENPLIQRRRNSLPSKQKERIFVDQSIMKVSRFQRNYKGNDEEFDGEEEMRQLLSLFAIKN